MAGNANLAPYSGIGDLMWNQVYWAWRMYLFWQSQGSEIIKDTGYDSPQWVLKKKLPFLLNRFIAKRLGRESSSSCVCC